MIALFCFSAKCRSFDDFNNTSFDAPEEIQHAICKIATEDIEASANATIRRELKGVCTSKEVMERLNAIEERLLNEIKIIKQMLQITDVAVQKPQTKLLQKLSLTESPKGTLSTNTESKYLYQREIEAVKNNRTVVTTELGKSFLYFWKIYDIGDVLKNLEEITSDLFYVQGNPFEVIFYPRHLGTHYIALELKNANNYYIPKHRFTILNQNYERGDLSSQVLGLSASLFRVASEKLSDDFIVDDSLIIKIVVVLH
ncbi:hypothetical protein RN001_006852 [Aquatica leii]|uniref:MATH domain-containing protein n=1 Tax=Aquatica leii TaxID=1421715 RepID=A0AAN7QLF8_9COLE|nr:hypothetical protein RN001_006852 [Aquatica leii]